MSLHPSCILAALALPASALTLTVDTNFDQLDSPAGGQLSLREAIRDANSGDTIDFDAALSGSDILLLSALGGTLTVDGKTLTIDASALVDPVSIRHLAPAGQGRLLQVVNGADVTLVYLNFSGSEATGNGGGMLADGSTLALEECRITDCSADNGGALGAIDSAVTLADSKLSGCSAGGAGGAIYSSGSSGSLDITGCTIENCDADDDGGGIFNTGTTLFDIGTSTIRNNWAATGGGIFNTGNTQLRMGRSSVTGNRSSDNGGGIHIDGTASILARNSTIACNKALQGGGLYFDEGASAIVSLSTVADNEVILQGGGIFADTTTLTLRNSVIADNSARLGPDIASHGSTLTRVEVNFIGENETIETDFPAGSPNGNGDWAGTKASPLDPHLGTLGPYGGATDSMHPLAGSPLIDNAGALGGIAQDQRGSPRPNGATGDLGAVEAATSDLVTTAADEDDGVLGGGTGVSLREALAYGTTGVVGFSPALDGATLNLASELSLTTGNFLIDASNLPNGFTIDGGGATRLFSIDSGGLLSLHHLTLSNGFHALEGGAILVDGDSRLGSGHCGFTTHSSGFRGGAIALNSGEVSLTDCDFTGNSAAGGAGFGGAIAARGPLGIRGGSFTGNQAHDTNPAPTVNAAARGGAIYFETAGLLSIQEASFGNNTADGDANEARGGAIYAISGSSAWIVSTSFSGNVAITDQPTATGGAIHTFGDLFLLGSTVNGNTVNNFGGGLSSGGGLYCGSGDLEIIDSTFTGNHATSPAAQDRGGAMTLDNTSASLLHTTISGNSADVGVGGIELTGFVNLSIENSIVAKSTTFGSTPDINKGASATVIPIGTNFIGHNATVPAEFPFGPPLVGSGGSPQDPDLGLLADNGGPTQTLAPTAGSPVIDSAVIGTPLDLDQRGFRRLRGAAPDLGAYESGNAMNYASWAAETIPGGFDATFEGSAVVDTTANGIDYAARLDPLGNPGSPLALHWLSPTEVQLSFPFRAAATDLVYRLRHSATLGSFSDELEIDLSTGSVTITGLQSADIDVVTETVTCVRTIGAPEAKGFWSLEVVEVP